MLQENQEKIFYLIILYNYNFSYLHVNVKETVNFKAKQKKHSDVLSSAGCNENHNKKKG